MRDFCIYRGGREADKDSFNFKNEKIPIHYPRILFNNFNPSLYMNKAEKGLEVNLT